MHAIAVWINTKKTKPDNF